MLTASYNLNIQSEYGWLEIFIYNPHLLIYLTNSLLSLVKESCIFNLESAQKGILEVVVLSHLKDKSNTQYSC